METSTASGGPAPSARRHRWPRRAAIALLSVAGAAVVLLLGAVAYVATPSGGNRLRRLAVEKVNAAIEGTLSVERLSLRGGHLLLRGVELRDPDGELVASVSSLEVRLRVAALLRKRIDVALVRIDEPEIAIEQDEGGSNLQRALAPRDPSSEPEKGRGEKSSLDLVLEDLDVSHGAVDVVQRSTGSSRHVQLEDLTVRGTAKKVGDAMQARLTVGGRFASPFEGPLHVSLDADAAGARKDVRISLQAGAAKLAATVDAEDDTHARARIESLAIPPEVARALVPGYPLRAAASVSGEARRSGAEVSVHLDARAASATARVDAELDLAAQRARRAVVAVRHVDLSELTADGPSSDIALGLTASGGGKSLEDLAGRLDLSVPPSPMAGETMGPVRVRAIANAGELQLPKLVAQAPGVRLEGRGGASKERLGLRGSLVARDLAAFNRTLGKLAGPNGLSVKGQGRLEFTVGGSAEHPSVLLDGSFPVLVHEKTRIDGLALHVDAPDLRTPTGARAHVAARTLALAPDKVFRAARLDVDGRGRQLSIDAAAHGYAELGVRARAVLSPGGRGATLHALSVRYPEARWSLEAPVEIEARPGLLRIAPLTLRSGDQAISVRVHERKAMLDASFALRSFDLAKLPRAFVDPRLRLGGVLDVEMQAKGRSSRPDLAAKVDLRRGGFKKYRNLQLRVDASYARDVAKGALAAKGEGIELTGTFDLPVKALEHGRRVPVQADFRVPELRLDESLRDLGVEEPITGTVSAQLSLRGTADDPRLHLSLRGRRLQARQLAPADVDLVLASTDEGPLAARVDLLMESRKSFLQAKTPFRLGQLLRKPPRKAELMAAAFTLDAEIRELPLRLLSESGVTSRPVQGALSARAHVGGTAASPRGHVSVDVKGLATQGLKPLDARLRLRAGEEIRADVRADQGGTALFAATASVGAAPKDVKDVDRVVDAPLSVDAHVGPLSLSELQGAVQPADTNPADAPPGIRGTLAGRLSVRGSLRDPTLVVRTQVDGLAAEKTPDGQATLSLDYRKAKEKLDLLLRSQNGGQLHASAAAGLDLSYPAVTRARPEAAPVEGSLEAKDFDPAFLSNLTGAVERVGGLLYADARVSGTMAWPAVKGRIEWKNGVLSTHGSGDFTDIHLLATGDNDRLELKDLTAKSGKGTAKLSAVATRTGAKAFRLHAAADVDKFPVVSQGQVAATVSVRGTVDGEGSPAKVTLKSLNVPEAHVELPEVHRKDVQKLDDPPDVVLTVRGKPVRGARSQQAAAASAASGEAGAGAAPDPKGAGHPGTQVTMFVNAPRNLWIQGKDVNTEIGLSEGFRVEYASEPKVFGDVNVLRGRLDVFGRRFDFQRDSKVSFTGPVLQPDLDVTAAYKNEMEQVAVQLKVQGQGEKLQLHPTSDPPLPETEIYTLLATGHTSLHHGSGTSSPSGEAASLVGSAAASQLKKTLSSKLPLDVLSIEAGDSGIAGSKLEAGTYVNDRLYLGFTGRLGADPMRGENSNEVDAEYQLSKHWSLNGSYGDAHAGGLSVNWKKDY